MSGASGDLSSSMKVRNDGLTCMLVYRPAFMQQTDQILSVSKNCRFNFANNRVDGIVSVKYGMPEIGSAVKSWNTVRDE